MVECVEKAHPHFAKLGGGGGGGGGGGCTHNESFLSIMCKVCALYGCEISSQ